MGMGKKWIQKICIWVISLSIFVLVVLSQSQQKRPEVPFVPTPEDVVEAMLELGKVTGEDFLYDLGCGDGRIVITAAKKFGCQGVGIDIDPERITESREAALKEGVEDKVEFLQMDLFEADLSRATVVTLYLLTEVNLRLRPKLLKELNPGTRVISHDFGMGDWASDNQTFVEDYWETHVVYLWIIPANVSGTWTWSMPLDSENLDFTLQLVQAFQYLSGTAYEGSASLPVTIEGGKITGNKIEFALERKRRGRNQHLILEGVAVGNSIEGTMKVEGTDQVIRWRARRDPSTIVPLE